MSESARDKRSSYTLRAHDPELEDAFLAAFEAAGHSTERTEA